MSFRQQYPSSDPGEDLAKAINALQDQVRENTEGLARRALPEPLTWRFTNVAPGPPPTFQIEILNPLTGASIALGVI